MSGNVKERVKEFWNKHYPKQDESSYIGGNNGVKNESSLNIVLKDNEKK